MLIILGGLPGVGKTTIARKLAEKINAVYLRIDTIETAIKNSSINFTKMDDAGYLVAFEVAKDNLIIGHTIVADSVNPIAITRESWRDVAHSTGKKFIEIEIICSDQVEHKARVEMRVPDIKGHRLPTWEEVQSREYYNWECIDLTIDTSKYDVCQCINIITRHLLQCDK